MTRAQTLSSTQPETNVHYPFSELPAPGGVTQVAPGVNWLRMPLPFELDHINLWLLEDDEGWSIIDCGFATSATQELWQKIFTDCLAQRPIKRVIVTHFHPDHIGLAAWLTSQFQVDLWITQGEFLSAHAVHNNLPAYDQNQFFTLFQRHGLETTRLQSLAKRKRIYATGVPALPNTYRRMLDDENIYINGRAWRVMVGYGHAPEHAALYCQELGVFISGDMVLPRISTNVSVLGNEPEGNPLQLFLASLEKYATLPSDTLVLPSHGKVFTGLHTRISQLQQHHATRLSELYDVLAEPATAAQLLPVLFKRSLDDHQISFAMGEMIAHLNYLLAENKLQRQLNAEGVYRFVRAK